MLMPKIKIIGFYPIETEVPVHLIELSIHGVQGTFKIGDITQEIPDQPPENWQCPYMERVFSASGDEVFADEYEGAKRSLRHLSVA